MAKVYLVSFGDHECGNTAGIFSTKEKAIEAGDKVEEILTQLNDMYKFKTNKYERNQLCNSGGKLR